MSIICFIYSFMRNIKVLFFRFDYFSEYAHCSRVVGYHDFVQRLLLQHCRQTFPSSSLSPTEKESISTLFIARVGMRLRSKNYSI